LVFDLNDFDETRPGPWEWDVKRLLASVAVVGRANGFDGDERERVLRTPVDRGVRSDTGDRPVLSATTATLQKS